MKLFLQFAALLTLSALRAVTLEPNLDQVLFPFQPQSVKVLAGSPPESAEIVKNASLTGGDLFALQPQRKGERQSFYLGCDQVITSDVRRIGYWLLTRGSSACEVNVAIEEADGEINLYRAPASGDSPWTYYEWEVAAPDQKLRSFDHAPASGKRKFKGLVIHVLPFTNGTYRFGEVVMSSAVRPPARQYAWTLRDVAEDLRHQSAFSGFKLSYEGCEAKAALPAELLFGSREAVKIKGMIYNGAGDVFDNFAIDRSQVKNQNLILPALPRGNYWLDLKRFDGDGKLLTQTRLSYLVNFSPVATLPPTQTPQLYDILPESAKIEFAATSSELAIPRRAQAGDILSYSWRNPYNQVILTGESTGQNIKVPAVDSRPMVLKLDLQLLRDGAVIDRRSGTVTFAGVKAPAAGTPAKAGEFFPLDETETVSVTQDDIKASFADHLVPNGSNWSLNFYWSEIEPVEGVILYPVIDRYLEIARQKKIPVTLTFYIHLDHVPEWLWFDQLLDQNGRNMHYSASFTRKFSPASERTLKALGRMVKAIVSTYKNDPSVIGWNFSQGIESFWSDASRNHLTVGFDQSTVNAFMTYVKKNQLAVTAPPVMTFDGKADLRPEYLAWEEFRQQLVNCYFKTIFAAVREAGGTQPIKSYAGMGVGDITRMLPVYKEYGAELCFGGGDSPVHAFLQSQARHAQVPLVGESFALPPFAPTLKFVMFTEIAYGDMFGGINIMWGRHFTPGPVQTEALAASSEAAQLAQAIRDLGKSELVTANGALMFGMLSMVNVSRSSMWIDWVNLNTDGFAAALNAVVQNNLQMPFVTDATPLEILKQYRIIVLNESPILRDQSAADLAEYVKNGGTLIIMGNTGRYNQDGRATDTLTALTGAKSGETVKFGRGKIIKLAQSLDWGKEFMPLLGANGFSRPVRPVNGSVRTALRRQTVTGDWHLYLFGKTWESGNPHAAEVAGKTVSTKVEIKLPAGDYSLSDVLNQRELGVYSAEALRNGVDFTVNGGELKIIKMVKK